MPDFNFDDIVGINRPFPGGVYIMADDGGPVQRKILLDDIIAEAVAQAGSGGGGALPALATPTLSAASVDADTIRLTIGAVTGETGYRIEVSNDGATGWTLVLTTSPDVATYDVNSLPASTTRHFRVKAIANPATNIDSAFSSVASATTGAAGPSLEDILFPTNTGLVNSSQVFDGANNATNYANFGLGNKKLSAGELGIIMCQYNTGDKSGVFGFNLSSASEGYTNYEFALFFSDTVVYKIESGGSLGAYAAPVNGNWYGIRRIAGGVIKLQYSSTSDPNPANWTDIATYFGSSTAELFIGLSIDELSADGKFRNPKIYNGVSI